MKLGQKIFVISLFFFMGIAFFTRNTARGQTGTAALPREVLRPQYGEEPRFPKDYVIGELGRGEASEESYRLARQIAASLMSGDGKADRAVFPEQKRLSALSKIRALGARSWRVGGGRSEGEGSYSFLVRFLGRENSITGELYLQWEEPKPAAAEPVPAPVAEPAAVETITAKDAGAESAAAAPETTAAAMEFNVTAGAPAEAAATSTAAVPVAEAPRWRVDDILLEPPRGLTDGKYSPGGADMTPYERFF